MKKTIKWISAICAAVMLLSVAMTATAMADEPTAQDLYQDYLISQLGNAVYMPNSQVYVPGLNTTLSLEEYQRLWNLAYNSGYYYPGINYPGLNPGYNVINHTMDQYTYFTIPYGTNYTYRSHDTTVVTVNAYGQVFAVGAGSAAITIHNGLTTVGLFNITVNPVDVEESNLVVRVNITDSSLYVGQSASVSAVLTTPNGYLQYSSIPGNFVFTASDSDVITVSGSTVTAVGAGTAEITATLNGTALSGTATVTVYEKQPVILPSYPSYGYPGYYPNYPGYDFYPGYGFYPSNPGFNYYPGYGYYPNYSGSLNNTGYINWTAILGIDTDIYDVEQEYTYIRGVWTRTFTLIPKDGSSVSEYETIVKRMYVAGTSVSVAVRTPVDYEPESSQPVDPGLTKEELEELKKAQEEAKRLEELNANIAKALEGKMEWYDVYSDLTGDSYYNNAVHFALSKLYVTGNDDGTFGADDTITYGYLEDVICKYLKITSAQLEKKGILSYKDENAVVTRENAALVFAKLAESLGVKVSSSLNLGGYKDYKNLASDCRTAFAWAVDNNLLSINYEYYLKPDDEINKVRLCTMLYQLDLLVNPAVED